MYLCGLSSIASSMYQKPEIKLVGNAKSRCMLVILFTNKVSRVALISTNVKIQSPHNCKLNLQKLLVTNS